jgi:asparagine synthase (glutamine-hydrolysing)
VCGIAGVSGATSSDAALDTAERMNAQLVHRGPDEAGSWAGERDALAMRRLSIIDLAGGHQPMVSPSGTAIVFNGEIYNYRRLRDELAGDGWEFRTHSDTEVVLALYELHGIDAFDRLEGMFAIALRDGARGRLHLVRDRMGKKPLYYTDGPGELLFASEVKALLVGLSARPALSRQALHDFLTLRYVPGPATVWEGILKLPPGHRLDLDLRSGKRTLRRWWRVAFDSQPASSDADVPAEFAELFGAAVDDRLVAADVPVGVLLSGGLDSSAVSAAAVERGHRAFHTFSVGFDEGGDFSELGYARQMAEHVGARHHEVVIGQDDFVAALPELVHMTDEPLADLATVPLHAVSKLAREHVTVVLSGEGSDEVLAGYDIEVLAAQVERLRPLRRLPAPSLRAAARVLPEGRGDALGQMARFGWSGLLRGQRAHMTHVFGEDDKRGLWRDPDGLRSTDSLIDSWYAAAPSAHPIDQLQQVYCESWLVEDLLMKADKATMATSLELRCPFLDSRLVEWAARAPLEWKVGSKEAGWRSKRVLREYAAERLPREIVERPKRGFPVPAYRWLAGDGGLAHWAEKRLGRAAGLSELFNDDAVRAPLAAARAGDSDAAHRVWSLLVLDHWLERWT